MAQAIASTGLYGIVYDNINMNFHVAEQVVGCNNSQENGTYATLFPLFNAKLDCITTKDFQTTFLNAPPLLLSDLIHTKKESNQFNEYLAFTVARVAVMFGGEGFKKFAVPLHEHQPASSNQIPSHKTLLYPLPAMHIDESSVIGNVQVDKAIVDGLGLSAAVSDFAK
ncbi:hypothetical protein AN958_09779 [Leucoagaricus sp. SymC.cos]|nr:hypothetical protein AN958_09779 [Leucoagaricus sp. SymC.cos]